MVTIGTDPELFVKDERTGAVVPICGIIGGSKGKPLDLGDGYGVQEDNVMLEFNTPPCSSPYSFVDTVREGISRCADFVRTKQSNLTFDNASERLFGYDLLNTPQAAQFGCSAEYDAYSQGASVSPVDPRSLDDSEGAWRFAGGHVHLGYESSVDFPKFVAASFADVFLGLPSVNVDKQARRRELYGRPGRYRPTSYGIEYRVLSNFWVMDEGMCEQVAFRAESLGAFLETATESRLQKLFVEIPWGDVRQAISDEDEERAMDVLAYLNNELKLREVA